MNKGFIALTITLSVAGILLALVAGSALDSALFFDLALRKDYRFKNYYNAGNCIDQAILGLTHDYFYSTTTPIYVPHFDCSVISVTAEGDLRTILTRGDFQKAYVYRSAIVRMKTHDLEVVKIE
jgi:hypothetical protein